MSQAVPTSEDDDTTAVMVEALALWEADRTTLLMSFPFLAQLALHLEIVPLIDARLETASTDGQRIFVNPYFLRSLTPAERTFVLAHEVLHCALSHFGRSTEDDPERWNVALDHEVNACLGEFGLEIPPDAVYFEELHGSSAEEVYGHLRWDVCIAFDTTAGRAARGPLADHHPSELEGAEPDQGAEEEIAESDTDAVRQRWQRALEEALRNTRGHASDLPPALSRAIGDLAAPTVPWRSVLGSFVQSARVAQRSWLPPSRRHVWRGLHLPSRRARCLDLAVAIDTSGSTQFLLDSFLSEIGAIARSFESHRIHLLHADFEVTHEEWFGPERPLRPGAIELCGGRGTSFEPVFERLARGDAPDALVYFTDGFGPAPKRPPDYPVLWAITPNGVHPCSWGAVVEIEAP